MKIGAKINVTVVWVNTQVNIGGQEDRTNATNKEKNKSTYDPSSRSGRRECRSVTWATQVTEPHALFRVDLGSTSTAFFRTHALTYTCTCTCVSFTALPYFNTQPHILLLGEFCAAA